MTNGLDANLPADAAAIEAALRQLHRVTDQLGQIERTSGDQLRTHAPMLFQGLTDSRRLLEHFIADEALSRGIEFGYLPEPAVQPTDESPIDPATSGADESSYPPSMPNHDQSASRPHTRVSPREPRR